MRELSDITGWTVDADVDLSEPVDLNGYILFLSKGNKKNYLIMTIVEDESGELFYAPGSRTILEDRIYGLYDNEHKTLTPFGELCIEYGVFTYDEIIEADDRRCRMNKDIRLLYLKRKMEIFKDMAREISEVRKEYETLKNS